jgi:hypothetical protein
VIGQAGNYPAFNGTPRRERRARFDSKKASGSQCGSLPCTRWPHALLTSRSLSLPRLSCLCERVWCSQSVIYRLQVLLLLKSSQHEIELTPDNRVVHWSLSDILFILPNPLAAWLSPDQSSAHTTSRFSPTLSTEPNKEIPT